jgi:hypothetical protein
MKHDIDMSKTINLTFKLVVLYSNMHKYKVDRMENHYIQYFDSTFNTCYNNLKGKPTSYKKYWYLKRNNMICKCWSHMLWFSNHKRKNLAFIASSALFFIGALANQMSSISSFRYLWLSINLMSSCLSYQQISIIGKCRNNGIVSYILLHEYGLRKMRTKEKPCDYFTQDVLTCDNVQ